MNIQKYWEESSKTRHRRLTIVLVGLFALALPAYVWSLFNAVEFSDFMAVLVFLPIGYGLWFAMDWAVKDIDTFAELQYRYVEKGDGQVFQEKPNLAWAIVLAGYLILVGLVINAAAA